MKICLICTEIFAWGKYGGFGRATRTIGRELVCRGYDVHAVVPLREDQDLHETLDGIKVHGFPMHAPWKAMQICREVDADIYHSCEPSMSSYFAMRARPYRKHMITCRDPRDARDWWLEFTQPSAGYFQVLVNWLNEHNRLVVQSVRRADAVFVPAHFLIEKVGRIYDCAKPATFLPTPIPVRREVVKSQRPTVCFVARLDRRKRPELFCELARRHPQISFVMVGKSRDPAFERQIRDKFAAVINLEFTGFVDQFSSQRLSDIFAHSWILVNTASREGLPNAFLEAMAHRCAILSAVDPDGVVSRFGFHAVSQNFDEGLKWLLENDRWRDRGQEGCAYVSQHFGTEQAIAAHMLAYRELLGISG